MPGPEVNDFREKAEEFINDLKYGRVQSLYNVARTTVHLLRRLVAQSKVTNAKELMDVVRSEGQKLMIAQPLETIVGNMVRRVLNIIREEYNRCKGNKEEDSGQDSLQKMLLDESKPDDYEVPNSELKPSVIESIGELLSELETSIGNISSQALEHIHSNEVIMTCGNSRTVEAFLKQAGKKRAFQVIVAECAPFFHGQTLAANLAKEGINTTLITDSAIFAMMARVNKVIIGTNTILANGGLVAVNGSHTIAIAAKHYSVPLIVCAPMYKLSPQFSCTYEQEAFNKFVSPHNVFKFSEGGGAVSRNQAYNPVFDYVPPELVTLVISNIGGYAPSYVYRLLNEMYHQEDLQFK